MLLDPILEIDPKPIFTVFNKSLTELELGIANPTPVVSNNKLFD